MKLCGRVLRGVVALGAAVIVAACGGGTEQQRTFRPDRLIVFGDEESLLAEGGRKYTVNALTSAGALDCASNPLWVQTLATTYEMVFAQCNPNNALAQAALMRAAVGATVDGVRGQVDAMVAAGGFTNRDLVAMMAGRHDLLALYAQYPARSEEALLADARAAGDRLAAQVNRVVALGPRVIIATVPDLGFSPFALAEKAAHGGVDRAALISRLVAAFNGRLRVSIVNDGRLIGLVLADETIQVMARVPEAFGLSNVVAAVCATALPDCTTSTLVQGGAASTYLWADATRIGVQAQARIGLLAQQRALNNPF